MLIFLHMLFMTLAVMLALCACMWALVLLAKAIPVLWQIIIFPFGFVVGVIMELDRQRRARRVW